MKTKILLSALFASFLLVTNLSAQNPSFQWAKQMGSPDTDLGNSIAVDANGNVYVTGIFWGPTDFDPGAGTINLTSRGKSDIFIQKLDANGNLLWVKQMGGTGFDGANSITTDASGNIYTTGYFNSTVDFDPGTGTINLISAGYYDVFIQKLDANGNFIWVKQMGGAGFDEAHSITTDAMGNIYTNGYFEKTVDFDPGAGTSNLISAGSYDVFIQKIDSAGNFLWAKQMGGTDNDYGLSVTTDARGNVYSTGVFSDTADFDPGTGITNLTCLGEYDIFIQKLDANGVFIWAKQMGSLEYDWGLGITTDATGNVYTTGRFTGNVDFDPGAGTVNLTSAGSFDGFIQKLDSVGNFVWVRQMGGLYNDYANSITTDANGNIYASGTFGGIVDFDPGEGIANLTSAGNQDIFIQKLDANGHFVWATGIGGADYEEGNSITTNANGDVYITGYFQNTVDFDPGAGTSSFTSKGSSDIFILKLSQTATVGITENTFTENIRVYPNPTSGNFAIEFDNIQESVTARILSLTGQVITNKQFQNTNNIQLEINQPNGIYILETIDEQGNKSVLKIIKQ